MFETSQTYEARAYMFQGLKYEERKYRLRQFKRCQGNRFCEQSLEQGGKKWVVSRCMMTGKNGEEVLLRFPSPSASCKKLLVVPSCHDGKRSNLPSQIPTTAIPNQLDQAKESMSNQTPNDIQKVTSNSLDAHRAMRAAPTQSKACLVGTSLARLKTVGEDRIPVLAEDSAIDPRTSSRPSSDQEVSMLPSFHNKENAAGDSTSGSRKQKSPEQVQRRRERRRRAQQIRRMMNSDKQSEELTPRVFMQWEKSEVQGLLYKQELALKSAHQAELQKQELRFKSGHQAEFQKKEPKLKSAHQAKLQQQELRLKSAHQAELQQQELRLKSAHQAELQKKELEIKSAHQAELQKQELRLKSNHQAELQNQEWRLKSVHQGELQKQELRLNFAKKVELLKQELRLKSNHQAELQVLVLRLKLAYHAELQEQRLTLKSNHQAELQNQEWRLKSVHQGELQKQELRLNFAKKVELLKQELRLKSAHQAELQMQRLTFKSALQAEQYAILTRRNQKNIQHILRTLDTCQRLAGDILGSSHPAARLRKALSLLGDSISLALEWLRAGKALDSCTYEDIHCE